MAKTTTPTLSVGAPTVNVGAIATPGTIRHLATLGPKIRLVVFKFLIRSESVPDCIPRLLINRSSVTSMVQGVKVLPSTPDVWLVGLRTGLLNTKGNYVLVGARVAGEKTTTRFKMGKSVDVKTSDVRFTFCHRQHLNDTPLHENFVERFNQLVNAFVGLTRSNLWMVEGYLNPYLNEDGTAGKGSVLMLNCAGRKEAIQQDGKPVMVFEGWREQVPTPEGEVVSRGIGPKVSILNKASNLKLAGKKVQLVTP